MSFWGWVGCIAGILLVGYLFLTAPSLRSRKVMQPFGGVLYAHRGLYDNKTNAPENSMAAFKKAVDAGYGIETDIQLTKDHVPVLFHDFTLERMVRNKNGQSVKGKVSEYTVHELQQFHLLESDQTIPRLTDFLTLVGGKVPLILEYKQEGSDHSHDLCQLTDYLLAKYQGPYCIESFNPRVVHWYRHHHAEIPRGQLADMYTRNSSGHKVGKWFLENLFTNFWTRPDFIAYNWRYADNFTRRVNRTLFHNVAVAWTIQSEKQLADNRKKFDVFIFDRFVPANGPKA